MTLPRANSIITPVSFYPDKVTLNYQFEHSFPTPLLTRCFFRNGLNSRGLNAWSGHIALTSSPTRRPLLFPLRVSRPNFRAPLNCYLDLNVLRDVRRRTSDPNGEIPTVANADNLIPANLVQQDNRWAWTRLDDLRQSGLQRLNDIFKYIHEESPSSPAPHCSHVSVSSVEVTIDFGTANPRHMVREYSPAFGALLRNVERREYLGSAIRVERPEADWMVHGFIANGDRLKMYAKTNQRVRWEYRFERQAFDRLGIPRSLSSEGSTFAAIFLRCAAQASRTFAAIRARTRPVFNINQQHTPMDFVSRLATCIRDPDSLRELLDCLIYTDKVDHSLFKRGLVERLRRRNLLQPSLARGYSCVPLGYIRALNALRRAQHGFFSTRLLQPIANHAILPRPPTACATTRRVSGCHALSR